MNILPFIRVLEKLRARIRIKGMTLQPGTYDVMVDSIEIDHLGRVNVTYKPVTNVATKDPSDG